MEIISGSVWGSCRGLDHFSTDVDILLGNNPAMN